MANRTFSYDANGNQTGWTSDNNGTRRIINWDEDNRIAEVLDNGDRNTYVYDDKGNRVIKIGKQGETVYVNQYYVVRNRSIASKHFFAGSSRIATRLVMGTAPGNNFRGNGGNANGGGNGNTANTPSPAGNGQGNNGNAYAYGHDKEHGQSGQEHGNNGANGNNDHSNTPSPVGEGRGEGSGHGKGSSDHGNAGKGNTPSPLGGEGGGEGYDVSSLPGNSDKGLENALANGQGHKYGIYKHLERAGLSVDATGEIVAAGTGGTTTANGQSDFTYYYHPDHLGSTGYVTDANGKLYEHTEYFPFGETWVQEHSNTLRTPYLFTGKELDQETGLYYFGARYYDPRTSVWQSADPILEKYLGGKPAGGVFSTLNLNLYAYAHLTPLVQIDIDGRWSSMGIPFIAEQVHQNAISKVLRNQVGTLGIALLRDQQIMADRHQKPEEQYMHAMMDRNAGMSKEQFIEKANKFAKEQLAEAKNENGLGKQKEKAWRALGNLIHLLQDATSPMHEKFQDYGNTDEHTGGRSHLQHGLGEKVYPKSGSQERANLEGATQWGYDLATGKAQVPDNFFDPKTGELNVPKEYLQRPPE